MITRQSIPFRYKLPRNHMRDAITVKEIVPLSQCIDTNRAFS